MPGDWDALLSAAQDTPAMFAALVVEWATGLRRGELLALKWEDVDFDRSWLYIRRAIQIRSSGYVLADTKTQASKRLLPLPPEVMTVLRVHKANQAAARLVAGPDWKENGLIFPTSIGTLFDPRNWSKRFDRIAKSAGLAISVHNLRHDLASRIVDAGAPIKDAQYRMGHATVTMLLDLYAHRMNGGQDKVTQTISAGAPDVLKIKDSIAIENRSDTVRKMMRS